MKRLMVAVIALLALFSFLRAYTGESTGASAPEQVKASYSSSPLH